MWILISVLLAFVLILVGVLQLWSCPGKPAPFVDKSGNPIRGSISEKAHVYINGVKQGMFIKGKDINNPVLLFLHDGFWNGSLDPAGGLGARVHRAPPPGSTPLGDHVHRAQLQRLL